MEAPGQREFEMSWDRFCQMERHKGLRRRGYLNNIFPFLVLSFLLLLWLTGTPQGLYFSFARKGENFLIPRVIHRSFLVQNSSYSCTKENSKPLNSYWQYMCWTKEETRKLVIRNYAWLLDIYDNLPSDILRKELSKFLFLYSYGGVFKEDEPGTPDLLYSLFDNKCAVLAVPEIFRNSDLSVSDFLAGVPFHPFFLLCIRKIIERYHHGLLNIDNKLLDSKTLKELYEEWQAVIDKIYIENTEEPGIEPSNSTLIAWGIDKLPTSKVVPCYEVFLVSKASLFLESQ